MNTQTQMKLGLAIACLVLSSTQAFAQVGGSNGGGLIHRNGENVSFSNAGIELNLPTQPLSEGDLPDLELYETKLDRISLSQSLKYRLLRAISNLSN